MASRTESNSFTGIPTMSLTQQQIDEAGQAFNEAMGKVISTELRGQLVTDLRNPSVGNQELIKAVELVKKSAWPGYVAALDAYLSILKGGAAPVPQPSQPSQPQTPAPSQPPPSAPASGAPIGAYQLPIRPLTVAEMRATVDVLARYGSSVAPRVEAEVTAGQYSISDVPLIEAVKAILYSPISENERTALKVYLSAIDQRDMKTNALLAANDPRIVRVSGLLGSSSPPSSAPSTGAPSPANVPADAAALVAVLAGLGIKVLGNGALSLRCASGFSAFIGVTENDDGFRLDYNIDFENGWVDPRTGKRTSYANPKLPQLFIFFERDRGISFNAAPPSLDADGNYLADMDSKGRMIHRGPFDTDVYDGQIVPKRGKDLIIYPLGFGSAPGQRGEFVDICCMQAGRGIRIMTSTETANPQERLAIRGNGATTINGRAI